MNETRVNLRHLLEDIRDSYSHPVEEVILSELVANALDSGASLIKTTTDLSRGTLTVTDNGCGMRRPIMRDYHNIAATVKERGKGIGFAGIGAKLSLLVARSVTTETKGGYGSKCATSWRLTSDTRAPWKFIPSSGLVATARGTAVTIEATGYNSKLLNEGFLIGTIQKHYLPLFLPIFQENILRFLYKKGIEFWVNNKKLTPISSDQFLTTKTFPVRLGNQAKRLVGFGYLTKSVEELAEEQRGVGISCFGKVIKRGWEWIGITPKSSKNISGLVEIPSLAELLTTNKNNFLTDAKSLQKYYRYRKVIQEAILTALEALGEHGTQEAVDQKTRLKPLEREIEKTLGGLVNEFPELVSLVGIKRKIVGSSVKSDLVLGEPLVVIEDAHGEKVAAEAAKEETDTTSSRGQIATTAALAPDLELGVGTGRKAISRRSPGLKIRFEHDENSAELGRMLENDLWINTAHPAYEKAKSEGLDEYHIILATAWVLAGFVEEDKSPKGFIPYETEARCGPSRSRTGFINRFLSIWGKKEEVKTATLFK